MQAVLDAIQSGEINAQSVGVISSNHEAYALTRGKNAGIPTAVFSAKDYGGDLQKRDAALKTELDRLKPDYVLLVGYLGILSDEIIAAYDGRLINIHPALLPKYGGKGYYGLNVHKAVIAAGETVSGATVHYVARGIDQGEIIAQKSAAVLPGDTPETLQKRVLDECEHPLLVSVVKSLCAD
ncbi:MAG: phosphoribosylglycinamide formyltransferase [Clostridia bacterium]|nr:phosphoribosylglycinamide formyltransferase [Clostridia bacterium]